MTAGQTSPGHQSHPQLDLQHRAVREIPHSVLKEIKGLCELSSFDLHVLLNRVLCFSNHVCVFRCQVNLMQYMKLSTSRDFRINTATLDAALQEQDSSGEVTQSLL